MKKISILALVFALILTMAACGSRDSEKDTGRDPVTPSTNSSDNTGKDSTDSTNIPDPDVNTDMPSGTAGDNGTELDPGTTNGNSDSGKDILDDITGSK